MFEPHEPGTLEPERRSEIAVVVTEHHADDIRKYYATCDFEHPVILIGVTGTEQGGECPVTFQSCDGCQTMTGFAVCDSDCEL